MAKESETENVSSHSYTQWVEQVKNLDSDAWDVLLRHYAGDLRSDIVISLRKRGLSEDIVDDVEQETWLTAVRKIGEFVWQNEEKFYHWLRAIALNHIRGYRRSAGRSDSLDDILSSDTNDELDRFQAVWGHYESNIEDRLILRDMYMALNRALRMLKPHEQEIFVSWLRGKTPRQLALTYDAKPRSISMLLLRTKDKLKANLRLLKSSPMKDDNDGRLI